MLQLPHKISEFDRSTFREVLENIYACKYLGQACAPHTEQKGMPDQFQCPKGLVFNVPQPSAPNEMYFQWAVNDVISDNNLEVINAAYVIKNLKKDGAE